MVCLAYLWTQQEFRGNNIQYRIHPYHDAPSIHQSIEVTNDEWRIARHFEVDTLPGLLHSGLIKKYTRSASETFVFVAGNIWKKRSQFFKESLLKEIQVYNKIRGYALETRIVDCRSQRLLAQILSDERKEFFD